ncbi:MAG: gatA 2 [Betaproteobacteria bacterium]|jgi:aspartyl-tRNA(Asn)/glutamyl-tRNA(Gln) amidotransferase subunit A|nr:gatA 2 [Betaproteobacteria bacterium]
MTDDLHLLTLAEAAKLIGARKLSPVEYTDALLERIDTFEPQLNAFITCTAELARAQARQAQAEITGGRYRGPLHGIPFALKDIYNTKGILTSAGSKVCSNNIPDDDAAAARRLYDAGAVLLGKLQTHEFAKGGPSFDLPWPPARNPWNLEHFTGSSSSGSGAALAAGLVPVSLGTDTGGSIRHPASYCGVVGLKPTTGLVSRSGVIPNSFTFDHCGPMARTVEDCAIILQAIAGHDPHDAGSAVTEIPDYRAGLDTGLSGLRIGVLSQYWKGVPTHPALERAMEAAITVFEKLGARLEDCHTGPLQDTHDLKLIIAESEIFSVHHDNLKSRPGDFGRDFLGRVLPACLFQASDYVQASREHRRVIAETQPLYDKYDVLLTVGYGPAPRLDAHKTIGHWQKPSVFTVANVTGGPALVLPVGYGDGLPLGMQIIGRPFDDATVLRVGHAYQRVTDWHLRQPPLVAGTPQPAVTLKGNEPVEGDLDARTRDFVLSTARRRGLELDDYQTRILLEGAPYALAMAQRLHKPRNRMDQPALAFRLSV